MMLRLVRRYGVRVGNGDPVDLTTMLTVRDVFDEAITDAARAMNAAGFSFTEIADALGISRQAAWQRFGKVNETNEGQPASIGA